MGQDRTGVGVVVSVGTDRMGTVSGLLWDRTKQVLELF